MKTNHKLIAIGALLAGAAALCSCDNIKESDRYIEMPAVESERVVLLEDFTGQKCVNCPDAHEIIEALMEQYPDNLVPVSIHGGGDAFSFSATAMPGVGLRTDESQTYCDSWDIAALPAGVIDRTGGVKNRDDWAAMVRNELERPCYLNLGLEARVEGGQVIADVTLAANDNVQGNLQLWVVEDGIVARQLSSSGWVRDYVHNNVFRASVNGHDGEAVNVKPHTDATTITRSIDIDPSWNSENLSVVAFVYNSKGVEQAARAKAVAE